MTRAALRYLCVFSSGKTRSLRTITWALISTSLCLVSSIASLGQPAIPLGSWRIHSSFSKIQSIALSPTHAYGSTETALLVVDKSDKSLSVINKLNGLSGTGISTIAFDDSGDQLLIGYSDGNLDILKDNIVTNFSRLRDINTLPGSKRIHHIVVRGGLAYLSTDFGVVVFDLARLELKETWRDLEATGKNLPIFGSTFRNDSVFLATSKGIIAGSLNTNLLDFNNWKRFDTGELANQVSAVEVFGQKVYAAISTRGIFVYQQGAWVKAPFLQNGTFNQMNASAERLLIATSTQVWEFNTAGSIKPIETPAVTSPLSVKLDGAVTWIGDNANGLLTNESGNFEAIRPNGPAISSAFRLASGQQKIYALAGGFNTTGAPLNNPGVVADFSAGLWETTSLPLRDLTDIDAFNNEHFFSSFHDGLVRVDASGGQTVYDDTNSPLRNSSPTEKSVFVSSIEGSQNGLWVANYGVSQPLHLFSNGSWQSFSFSSSVANYPLDMAIDYEGNAWMIVDPSRGGGLFVYRPATASSRYIVESAGTGGLPSRLVRSIAADRDGNIWVGTDQGVAYFTSSQADASLPIFENRFLLRDERVTAIAVDGGNRKWIGTERGAWLFGPAGEELVLNFTEENSPLLSNVVHDIAIDAETGEVFFATSKGILSYRGDATNGTPAFSDLRIFPNPVTSDFSGMVGISGLASDAEVKITDISGKLIWQTRANGGTASWNVRDYNGRRAATGVYLVFAATANGGESVVGKIAVVD